MTSSVVGTKMSYMAAEMLWLKIDKVMQAEQKIENRAKQNALRLLRLWKMAAHRQPPIAIHFIDGETAAFDIGATFAFKVSVGSGMGFDVAVFCENKHLFTQHVNVDLSELPTQLVRASNE